MTSGPSQPPSSGARVRNPDTSFSTRAAADAHSSSGSDESRQPSPRSATACRHCRGRQNTSRKKGAERHVP
eukprot:15476035-Alexandrium_andersonii.AAC.1